MDNEETRKLIISLITAQDELGSILRDLFKILVLEHRSRSTSTLKPDAALAEILNSASKGELKCLKSLKQDINVEKFYETTKIPYTFRTSICIDTLDITCMVEILKNVEGFPTNKKSMKGKNCGNKVTNQHIKCCRNCKHTCKYCGETSCSKKCDAADVDHKCLSCHEKKTVCNKNSTVCCPTCGVCRKCGESKPQNKQCPLLKLCIGLDVIHFLRNMISHMNPVDCANFVVSTSTLPCFPDCNTWMDLSKKLQNAGWNILSFMCNPTLITKTDPLSEEEKLERYYKLRSNLESKEKIMEERIVEVLGSFLKLHETKITSQLKQHLTEIHEKSTISLKEIVKLTVKEFKADEAESNQAKKESGKTFCLYRLNSRLT